MWRKDMSSKTKDLEKVAFGITGLFFTYWIYSILIADYLSISDNLKTVIGKLILFVFGL